MHPLLGKWCGHASALHMRVKWQPLHIRENSTSQSGINMATTRTPHLISILSLLDGKTDIMHPSLRCIFVCWELSISEEECSLFVCVESCRSVRKNCSLFLCVESCRSVRKSCSLFVCVESCRSVRKSCSLFLCLESCRSVRKSCSLLDVHLIKTKEYWG
jgi:hypothetical protein